MIPMVIVSVIGHVDDVYVVSVVTKKDFTKSSDLHRTVSGDGSTCLAACFLGSFSAITYSEVTGAMGTARVTHPQVICIIAATTTVFSIIGKLSVLLQGIPSAVLGGVTPLLFDTIASVDVQNLV